MHNNFYASGFLYHPHSQKILLHQPQSLTKPKEWELFEGYFDESIHPETAFSKIVHSILKIKITNVFSIYTYSHESTKNTHHLFYSLVDTAYEVSSKHSIFAWFSFKEIPKIAMRSQFKHDIVVGQRVIDAIERKEREQEIIQQT